MKVSTPHTSTFFLLFPSALSFTPCPLLGPAFPQFTLDTSDKTITRALKNLTGQFDALVSTDNSSHGEVSPNTTFSIALFSSDSGDAEDEPFFWQYHYTAPALNQSSVGSHTADQDSIYRIGGLTEVFTVWSLLLTGDEEDPIWDDPVTKHLHDLVDGIPDQDAIGHVRWDEVTVGQLASHMSGIARDYCSKDVVLQASPAEAGLPSDQNIDIPCCGEGSECGSSDLIRAIANRTRVTSAGQTPSYSNMAFQLLGSVIERRIGKPWSEILQHDIFDVLGMTETSIFAPENPSTGIIPVSTEVSGWSSRDEADEAKAQTTRWFKPFSHTSNTANSLGAPWVIYGAGSYPDTSLIDIYTVLSNEGPHESLYSSYLGLVPDFGVGFAILSADTEIPADLNAHADIIGDVVLEALMKTAVKQAAVKFGGAYKASDTNTNSSITVAYDSLPGLYIEEFVSNGVDFRATLAGLMEIAHPKDLSIRLYPTLRDSSSSTQEFRAVFQDVTEPADNGTPTCVSWMDTDKLQYGGRGLDEFIFSLDQSGRAANVEIPALRVKLEKK
ncbi:beta-lactamase/transpeptidase-like protein [Aspergillus varians]